MTRKPSLPKKTGRQLDRQTLALMGVALALAALALTALLRSPAQPPLYDTISSAPAAAESAP